MAPEPRALGNDDAEIDERERLVEPAAHGEEAREPLERERLADGGADRPVALERVAQRRLGEVQIACRERRDTLAVPPLRDRAGGIAVSRPLREERRGLSDLAAPSRRRAGRGPTGPGGGARGARGRGPGASDRAPASSGGRSGSPSVARARATRSAPRAARSASPASRARSMQASAAASASAGRRSCQRSCARRCRSAAASSPRASTAPRPSSISDGRGAELAGGGERDRREPVRAGALLGGGAEPCGAVLEAGGVREGAGRARELAEPELHASHRVEELERLRPVSAAPALEELERLRVERERLPQPGPRGGAVAGGDEVDDGALVLAGAPAVPRERLRRRLAARGTAASSASATAPWSAARRGGSEAVVDGVAHEGVVEPVARAVLVEEARLEAGVERGDRLVRGEPGRPAGRARSRSARRPPPRRRAAPRRAGRAARRGARIAAEGIAGRRLRARLALRPHHLLGEERRAVGDPVELRDRVLRRRLAEEVRDLLARAGEAEARDAHAAREAGAVEVRERHLDGRPGVDRRLVAGGDDHEPQRPRVAREEVEDVQRGLVRRVEVVEEQVHRAPVGDGAQRLLHRVEDALAHGLAGDARPRRLAGERAREGGVRAGLLGERVGEQAVRRAAARRGPAQHRCAARLREPRALDGEPRLADAALAEEDERPGALLEERLEEQQHRPAAAHRRGLRRAEQAARSAARAVEHGLRLRRADLAALDRGPERARLLGGARSARRAGARPRRRRTGGAPPRGGQSPARSRMSEPVRLLVGGIDVEHAAEERDRDRGVAALRRGARERERRVEEAGAEQRAASQEPGRVAILRREVAAIERDRLRPALRAARGRRLLERVHVHPDLGPKRELAVLDVHPAAAEDLAEVVERAVQVVGAARGILVRPERLDRGVAPERPSRRERDELQEVGRAPPPPRLGGDGRVRPDHLEPPEEVELQHRHWRGTPSVRQANRSSPGTRLIPG